MSIYKASLMLMVIACATPVFAADEITAAIAITRYCEPLVDGSSATKIAEIAHQDGLKDDRVGSQNILVKGGLLVSLSETPRACFVQAASGMTFAQGVELVDAWGARKAGASKSPTSIGPDGSPVRAWVAPAQNRSLLVAEQTNPLGQKVLAFIMARLPAKTK